MPPASGHRPQQRPPVSNICFTWRRVGGDDHKPTSHSRSASSSFQFLLRPRSSPWKRARRRDHMTSMRKNKRHWLNSDPEGGGSEECVCSCKYPAALLTETPRPKGPLHLPVLFDSSWILWSLFSFLFFYYIYSDVKGEHRTFRTRHRVGRLDHSDRIESEQIFSQILI